MKVLISAYAFEPGRGSEPEVGWTWGTAAANRHDVWVLTTTSRQPAVEEALAARPSPRLHPVYLDYPEWTRRWQRGRRGIHLYYLLWQLLAARRARELHRRIGFDLVHHLTYASDWMPAGVAHAVPRPFVWGPVGGATGMPWSMWRWVGARGLLEEAVRDVLVRAARPLLARPAARQASMILAQNRDTARTFADHPNVVIEPNPRMHPDQVPSVDRDTDRGGPRRVAFVGRLVALKGLRIAVATLAHPRAAGWTLDVFGSGPERAAGERLADRLGVRDRVRFRDAVPRDELLAELAGMDALLHPSMHDSAPYAVAEAVSIGLPVVCLDRGGPPIQIAGTDGVAVPAGRGVVGRLAEALAALPRERRPDDRWTTDRLPDLIDSIYERALTGPGGAPR